MDVLPEGRLREYKVNGYDLFTYNFIQLRHLHQMLVGIMMPEIMPSHLVFRMNGSDFRLLRKYLSLLPSESNDPAITSRKLAPTYMKYLLYGGGRVQPNPNIRIFNKVGMSWGFLTDVAYIVDFEYNIEFFVSVSMYCPPSQPGLEDYPYLKVGMPFLQALGEVLLQYERERAADRRQADPTLKQRDLSELRFIYAGD
jgi:hypothetical protein